MEFVAIGFVIVFWMFIFTWGYNNDLKRSIKSLKKDNEGLEDQIEYMNDFLCDYKKKMSTEIQTAKQSLQDGFNNKFKTTIGTSPWGVTGTLKNTTVIPTVCERLDGIEKAVGIAFVHNVSEQRGYVPTTPEVTETKKSTKTK